METEKNFPVLDFFLGATTPAGFKGYFDALCRERGRRMILVKSGPGCGKSTLMRKTVVAAAGPVEFIHCGSDPDSLDGVIFEKSGCAIVDATAPHVLEPEAPGADEQVLSLYHTISAETLRPHAQKVKELFAQNKCLRGRAARYIASAGGLLLDSRRAAACSTDFAKVRTFSKRLCSRLLPSTESRGEEHLRILTGITPKGMLFYRETVNVLCPRQIVFHDEYGASSRLLMELIRADALSKGYTIITCPCAMHPEDKIDHILIPSLGLGFLTSNSWHNASAIGQRSIHCSRFMDCVHFETFQSRLRFNRKAARELLNEAVELMAQAKSCHDTLETYYHAAVDFSAVEKAGLACTEALRRAEQAEG